MNIHAFKLWRWIVLCTRYVCAKFTCHNICTCIFCTTALVPNAMWPQRKRHKRNQPNAPFCTIHHSFCLMENSTEKSYFVSCTTGTSIQPYRRSGREANSAWVSVWKGRHVSSDIVLTVSNYMVLSNALNHARLRPNDELRTGDESKVNDARLSRHYSQVPYRLVVDNQIGFVAELY